MKTDYLQTFTCRLKLLKTNAQLLKLAVDKKYFGLIFFIFSFSFFFKDVIEFHYFCCVAMHFNLSIIRNRVQLYQLPPAAFK